MHKTTINTCGAYLLWNIYYVDKIIHIYIYVYIYVLDFILKAFQVTSGAIPKQTPSHYWPSHVAAMVSRHVPESTVILVSHMEQTSLEFWVVGPIDNFIFNWYPAPIQTFHDWQVQKLQTSLSGKHFKVNYEEIR